MLTIADTDSSTDTLIQTSTGNVNFANVSSVTIADNVSISTAPTGANQGDVLFAASGSLVDDSDAQTRNLTIDVENGAFDGDVQLPGTIGEAQGSGAEEIGLLDVTADTGTITLGAAGATYYTSGSTYHSVLELTGDTAENTNGGSYDSSGAETVSDSDGPWNLSVTTTDPAGTAGGSISLGQFSNNGGASRRTYVSSVTLDTTDDTTGSVTLNEDIFLDNHETTSVPGAFTIVGSADVIVSDDSAGDPLTIDTEQGGTATAGAIAWGAANVYADATGQTLRLITSTSAASQTAGAVTLGTVDDNNTGDEFLQSLVIDANGDTDGLVTLNGDISVDGGPVTIDGLIRLPASREINTEQGNDANGGAVNLAVTSGSVSATTTDVDLQINTATTHTSGSGGAVTLGVFDDSGTQFVRDLEVDTDGDSTSGTVDFTKLAETSRLIQVTNGGTLTVQATGSLSVAGTGGDIALQGTSIALNGDVSADDRVTLDSSGGVNQSGGTLTADNLLLLGSGTFTLDQATNDLDTVAADLDPGSISLTDKDDLTVGTVGSTVGITTGVDPTSNGGAVTIDATSGTITVDQAINTEPGSGGTVNVTGDVEVNAALTAGAGTITLNGNTTTGSDIIIDANITSPGTIDFQAPRDILVRAGNNRQWFGHPLDSRFGWQPGQWTRRRWREDRKRRSTGLGG